MNFLESTTMRPFSNTITESLRRGLGVLLHLLVIFLFTAAAGSQEVATTTLGYDAFGHRERLVSPVGGERTYDYSLGGVESAVRFNGMPVVDGASFGPHGQIEHYAYGSPGGQPQRRVQRTFDALGRMTSLSLARDGAGSYDHLTDGFRFDELSFVVGFDRSDRAVGAVAVEYAYDAQGQLKRFGWESQSLWYSYDARGNQTRRSAGIGVPGLEAVGDYDVHNRRVGWRYDGAGRLTEDDRHRYEYDTKGRLRLVRDKATGSWLAHHLYDDQGHRVRVLEPERVTYVHRDPPGTVIAETVLDGALETVETREHVLLNGQAVLEVTQENDGTERRAMQFADRLGNPAVTWTADEETFHEYSPFGHDLATGAASPHEGSHGFTGHEDDLTGLTYMRARYYDADASRFNQPDPARDVDPLLPASFNLYQYARNNPVIFVDPTGENPLLAAAAVGGGVDAGFRIVSNLLSGRPTFDGAGKAFVRGAVLGATGFGLAKAAGRGARALQASRLQSGIASGRIIAGPAGHATRESIELVAQSGGPTVRVITNLDSAPELGRSLSVAVGDGAEALAGAARNGTLFEAKIPTALIGKLEELGLATRSITMMGGKVGTEIAFRKEAVAFLTKFFAAK